MRNAETPDHGDWATFIKGRRVAAKMTGAELCRRLQIDRATLWRWETGKQRPENAETVAAIADLFGIDLDTALAAAGLRPAEVTPIRPEPNLDPDLARMRELFEDPRTPAELKVRIRETLRMLLDLAEAQPKPPVRRRKAN